ncbi:MAG: type II toxin-antitoxin system VapC family toxin [Hyphomicrobiaceae bacterium]|nr:type II toxin-antitoxin system VapC family toxin [Hyphomicrobiaceae bacterium]
MTSGGVLLDTCALLWLLEEAEFDAETLEQVEAAARTANLWVSPVSAWEVGMLTARGQLVLSMPVEVWFDKIRELPGVGLAEISAKIFIESSQLPGSPPGDIADRLLIATSRSSGLQLVTRDPKLLDYAAEGHIRAIRC